MKKGGKKINLVIIAFMFFIAGLWSSFIPVSIKATFSAGDSFAEIPAKGMVTMIDLGAKSCIPCKMMAPIMGKLEKEYKGKADILFIDVWKHPEQAKRFKIRAIPTQIFFDKDGNEVYRHVGFMTERAIVALLKTMGVD
jgi:thioredoxin 1